MKCEDANQDKKRRLFSGCVAASYAVLSMGSFVSGCGANVQEVKQIPEQRAPKQEATSVPEAPEVEVQDSILMATELKKGYPSKAIRTLESVNLQLGEEIYLEEVAALGSPEGITDQGAYITDVLTDVTEKAGVEDATKVMRACGYQCLQSSVINQAKRIYSSSENLEQFIEEMNTKVLKGGDVWLEDGNVVHATYNECYCNVTDPQKKLNKCYCQCSCGWYEKLFAEVVEHTVEVELVQSIKDGAYHCEIVITL